MPAPDVIVQLVKKFEENREAYRSGKYNEARLRQEFLDKFFMALGWDVYNEHGAAPDYADVVVEDSLEVEGTSKAPDYAFKIGRERKFYVEAKKPQVNIQYDIHPAYQLRRYAWNAHMALSVLTDFEEFAVYNCKTKPNPGDSAATGRDRFYKYTDYIEKWDEIAGIFSKDAVWKGAFDRFAETSQGKKGTTEVDDEFLKDMDEWRLLLARNIALRNPQVQDEAQLNYAVQMTIDRIIFLRICEDRGIEPEEQLKEISEKAGIYARLVELFQRADTRYNSGLFHFSREKGNDTPTDTFTPGLKIDDRVLKEIISSIYYPCPYIFKEIPVEILGQVYERFLGKVIRLTAGHQAKVEEKPEVRKAGGVYYTPKYIVDYIVTHTVGELLKGKTPEGAAQLKIVDPACGSGSFLLGAYQHLLEWHLQWYTENDPEQWTKGRNPALVQVTGGYRLTTQKKKEILINSIHGVDIDAQAVEVTKLSLLLKVLEEESGQLSLGFERVLPDLGKNIQCGNSLIGEDYFEGRLAVDAEERRRVNPFEWRRAFPQVFEKGGFDAVIGNPPYIRIQAMKEWAPTEVEFYKKKYVAASKGNYDIYVVFVEKGLSLLNPNGKLGFILPHKFFNAQYGEPLRDLIAQGKNLSKVIYFSDQQVFTGATTYTCLLFLSKQLSSSFLFTRVNDVENWKMRNDSLEVINSDFVTSKEWNFSSGNDFLLYEKLRKEPKKLGDISQIFVGLQTSADNVFLFKNYQETSDSINVWSKILDESVVLEKELLKPVIRSGELGRYWANPTARVLFPYEKSFGKYQLINEKKLKITYPKTYDYLIRNRKLLTEREHGKFKDSGWYQLYPKNLDLWERPKILIPYMVMRLSAYPDHNNLFFVNVTTGGFGLVIDTQNVDMNYLVGLLNSKLLDWFFKKVSSSFHGGYFAANKQFLIQLPIHLIDLNKPNDKVIHKHMVILVETMLKLHKKTPATPHEHDQLTREIEATDRQIDRLVYQLYGLSEEEIRIVEGNMI